MRALCIITLWIFGACSDAVPEYQATQQDYTDANVANVTGMDISDIDNPKTQCIIDTINKQVGELCVPVIVKYDYTYNLLGQCNRPNVLGCTLTPGDIDFAAIIYITIDGQRTPISTFPSDPIGHIYIHEIYHVISYCKTGNPDSQHKLLVWSDDLVRAYNIAHKNAEANGCYKQ